MVRGALGSRDLLVVRYWAITATVVELARVLLVAKVGSAASDTESAN